MTLEGSAVASWNTMVLWPDLRSGSERTLTMSTSSSRILPATSARIPSLLGTLTSIRQPGSGNPASVTRARITSEEVTIPNTSSSATVDPAPTTAPSLTTGRLSIFSSYICCAGSAGPSGDVSTGGDLAYRAGGCAGLRGLQ